MAWTRTGVAATALAAIAIIGSVTGAQLGLDRQKQQVRRQTPTSLPPVRHKC